MKAVRVKAALVKQFAVAVALGLVLAGPAAALKPSGRTEPTPVTLPLQIDGQTVQVFAHLYKPSGRGPFPLVIYSHGRAGTQARRLEMEYPIAIGHGNYWLRKGVAVIAAARPGYGATGGPDQESNGSKYPVPDCGEPDFNRTATQARRTIVALHGWAQAQPWVRKDRILLEGQSVGGLATVAAGALNLPGVVGIVNFAGGAGGNPETSPGRSCRPELLVDVYRQFGRKAKAPSLWLYAQNDLYWGKAAPRTWHNGYKAGGSDTAFIMTAPVEGYDGHQLLLRGGALWSVPLDAFVKKVGLTDR